MYTSYYLYRKSCTSYNLYEAKLQLVLDIYIQNYKSNYLQIWFNHIFSCLSYSTTLNQSIFSVRVEVIYQFTCYTKKSRLLRIVLYISYTFKCIRKNYQNAEIRILAPFLCVSHFCCQGWLYIFVKTNNLFSSLWLFRDLSNHN